MTEIASGAGVPESDARVLARALVDADLRGASTHGVSRLSIYVERIELGLIDPTAPLSVERPAPGVLVVDAGGGLGHVQTLKVLDLLMPIAAEQGVACATVRRSQHFGALSYYCDRAAAQGMILLAMTNCEPAIPPHGASRAFFGTNPIAASFPTGGDHPIKVDLATSVVARGNVIAAARRGEPIPEGWAIDPEGRPTTDAQAALAGAVLPMAGHKGAALALLVEAFAGVLSGAAVGDEVGSMYKQKDRPQDVGHFLCLFHISAFMPLDRWQERIDGMAGRIRALPPRPGTDAVLLPGDRSQATAARNRTDGIGLDPRTEEELDALCGRYGVKTLRERTGEGRGVVPTRTSAKPDS